MVQLKQVSIRLKSIKNIQKITKTMRMVSASKVPRAERELKAARPFGFGPRKFYECSKLTKPDAPPPKAKMGSDKTVPLAPVELDPDGAKVKRLYIAVTSDRGMCGGVHSGVVRRIRRHFTERKASGPTHRLVCVGDKSRGMLARILQHNIIVSAKNVGRIAPVFADASRVAEAVAETGFKYDVGEIFYNQYVSPVLYRTTVVPIFNQFRIEMAPNMTAFDDYSDQLQSYSEFTLAALIFYAMKESSASELTARMAAMDNATRNATDMIRKLTLLYNRTRQAVITRELIEIISGAAALKES